jgi:arylsulfatase A-like enzyme
MKYCFVFLLLSAGLVTRAAEPAARPNILWLIAEDMGPEALSCSGTPQVWTPNLDRLAAQGIRYTRCYNGMVSTP